MTFNTAIKEKDNTWEKAFQQFIYNQKRFEGILGFRCELDNFQSKESLLNETTPFIQGLNQQHEALLQYLKEMNQLKYDLE